MSQSHKLRSECSTRFCLNLQYLERTTTGALKILGSGTQNKLMSWEDSTLAKDLEIAVIGVEVEAL